MTSTQLYFSPQPTRSSRARWGFLEAGVSFEGHSLDIFKGEHKTTDFLSRNPLGLVPAAIFDDEPIIESSALALIAAAQHPERGLIPEQGTKAWRKTMQWVVFAPAELDRLLATITQHRLLLPPEERDQKRVDEATDVFNRRAELLADCLGKNDYMVGDSFTVADVCIGHSIVWAQLNDKLAPHPRLRAYLRLLQNRPAFQEVYGGKVEVFRDPHATPES